MQDAGRRWAARTVLLLVVLAGLTLRVWNINFDRGIGSHPDERSTACFVATTIDLPKSWNEFWDPTRSPLNPLWDRARQEPRKFTYGHFPLYLGVAMSRAWIGGCPGRRRRLVLPAGGDGPHGAGGELVRCAGRGRSRDDCAAGYADHCPALSAGSRLFGRWARDCWPPRSMRLPRRRSNSVISLRWTRPAPRLR